MKILIVGGDFGDTPKESGVVSKLVDQFKKTGEVHVTNGGAYADLESAGAISHRYDIVVWMPNIDNKFPDVSFAKKPGATLFVSKALRDNRTRVDAVTRIFKFNGNAVIAIKSGTPFEFELVDALDNTWFNGTGIADLVEKMIELHQWSTSAERVGSSRVFDDIDRLIALNKKVADESANQGVRYFGNLSTRCTKMFPSARGQESFLVSPRNSDKNRLARNDMVETSFFEDKVRHVGERKPSVDTPVQIQLYMELRQINFFIHGHRQVKDAPITEHYYPCGDLREVEYISKLIQNGSHGVINLKNHGFLIYASTIQQLDEVVNNIEFVTPESK